MQSLVLLIDTVLGIYIWLLIGSAILSWLVVFNVVNTRNQAVIAIGNFLYRITEPALRPIRRVLPNFGGIDISPVVLILLLMFLQNLLREYGLAESHFGAIGGGLGALPGLFGPFGA
jgi:YggT family protein